MLDELICSAHVYGSWLYSHCQHHLSHPILLSQCDLAALYGASLCPFTMNLEMPVTTGK
jgi:hypothetical protein